MFPVFFAADMSGFTVLFVCVLPGYYQTPRTLIFRNLDIQHEKIIQICQRFLRLCLDSSQKQQASAKDDKKATVGGTLGTLCRADDVWGLE